MRSELVLVLVHLVAESQRTLDTKLQGWWKSLYCVIQWTLCGTVHTVLARDLAPEAHGELLMNVLEAGTCIGNFRTLYFEL